MIPFRSLEFLALSLLTTATLQARLGEDETAIGRRFGEPIATLAAPENLPSNLRSRLVSKIYSVAGKKDGALVEVTFLEGRSVREFYFLEKEKSRPELQLNDTQTKFILDANSGNSSWESLGRSQWTRKDGQAKAERRETAPSVSLNANVPLQTQLLLWSGLELQSKNWQDFLAAAQRELELQKKQQEAEARKKTEQEDADRDLLRGI
jgi:hypothetical protein